MGKGEGTIFPALFSSCRDNGDGEKFVHPGALTRTFMVRINRPGERRLVCTVVTSPPVGFAAFLWQSGERGAQGSSWFIFFEVLRGNRGSCHMCYPSYDSPRTMCAGKCSVCSDSVAGFVRVV